MKIAILNTGNELLRGTTINSNLGFIGRELAEIGEEADCAITVPDGSEELVGALEMLYPFHDLVIITGGLGPTTDDMTREVVCDLLKLPMRKDPELLEKLTRYWEERHPGNPPPEFYLRQAMVPENGTILANYNGTASGLWLKGKFNEKEVYTAMLPGPPLELEPMVRHELIPLIRKCHDQALFTDKFMLANTPELTAQDFVIAHLPENIKVAYCASAEGTRVFLSGTNEPAVRKFGMVVRGHFGAAVLKAPHLSLVDELTERLLQINCSLATAESCTGGMVGATITDLPGVSAIYKGGIISYDNAVKIDELGIPVELLERYGAVSAECAEMMAEGVRRKFKTRAGLAATGIAGPSGGTPEKPVGLVYVAIALDDKVEVRELRLRGSRDMIRRRTTAQVLNLLRDMIVNNF